MSTSARSADIAHLPISNHQSRLTSDNGNSQERNHMSTFHTQSSIHRNPNIKPGLRDALRLAWYHWRTRLARASRLFTGPLALLAIIACDGPGGGATAATAASGCPG